MACANLSQRHQQPQQAFGVTELILSASQPQHMAMVLPMIAQLVRSNNNRWLSWITTKPLDRSVLLAAGIDISRLRFIYAQQSDDTCWITWEALRSGTSHTVIATPGILSSKALQQLEEAARIGKSQGLLLRAR